MNKTVLLLALALLTLAVPATAHTENSTGYLIDYYWSDGTNTDTAGDYNVSYGVGQYKARPVDNQSTYRLEQGVFYIINGGNISYLSLIPGIYLTILPENTTSSDTSTYIIYGEGCPDGLECNLYMQGVPISNPQVIVLTEGQYLYTYNTTGNINYNNQSVNETINVSNYVKDQTNMLSDVLAGLVLTIILLIINAILAYILYIMKTHRKILGILIVPLMLFNIVLFAKVGVSLATGTSLDVESLIIYETGTYLIVFGAFYGLILLIYEFLLKSSKIAGLNKLEKKKK